MHCPCQSSLPYDDCCAALIRGDAVAPTAERLMRSRYTAYATGHAEYLLSTWHATTRPEFVTLDPEVRWYRLDILSRFKGGMLDKAGTVEFEASYRTPSGVGQQHENSRFVKESGRWYYLAEEI